jgi:hypothetical protein
VVQATSEPAGRAIGGVATISFFGPSKVAMCRPARPNARQHRRLLWERYAPIRLTAWPLGTHGCSPGEATTTSVRSDHGGVIPEADFRSLGNLPASLQQP